MHSITLYIYTYNISLNKHTIIIIKKRMECPQATNKALFWFSIHTERFVQSSLLLCLTPTFIYIFPRSRQTRDLHFFFLFFISNFKTKQADTKTTRFIHFTVYLYNVFGLNNSKNFPKQFRNLV